MGQVEGMSEILGQCDFDFYRCYRCHRLLTRLEELNFLTGKVRHTDERKNIVSVCPCGGSKFSPCNLVWYDWLKPRVLWFAWLRWRGVA